ncbi:hypothetical protein Z517_03268 [Fonsecaea pedrosoi CBS 271.37]|uniref:Zn(2)-C6 fungal-type domain-containing protein n=1 Tax=Fonsecaea pedrosoi CBS 271.37 TaxID=1442368 RepID=A0A0D2FBP4_9EURO|nr:uncharacterized protein Z517_03268 [Fonsecaea pedrosoi CBS 271.37]KIW84022.1 hypothetical protein Z517_03268 [Fonsecaea pedrosoi CBS 271.37]
MDKAQSGLGNLEPPTSSDQDQQPPSQPGNLSGGVEGTDNAIKSRSCFACRRRKVKCNKKQPCENCVKMQMPCNYPTTSRGKLLASSPELLRTIQSLAQAVHTLEPALRQRQIEPAPRPVSPRPAPQPGPQISLPQSSSQQRMLPEIPPSQLPTQAGVDVGREWVSATRTPDSAGGRLVRDQGKLTYVKESPWNALNLRVYQPPGASVSESEDEDDDEGEEEGDFASKEEEPQPDYSFFLGLDPGPDNASSLQPPPQARMLLWSIFKENIDPMTKIVHVPTLEPRLVDAMRQDHRPSDSLEALCFAIFFGSVTSLSNEECQSLFSEDRSTLCSRFRLGVERALAKCKLVSTDDLEVLQAFVLYLVLLRNHSAQLSWKLTGLAARLGQSLGLHRSGDFGLPLFQLELRRRLWWQIAILEAPASEDSASEYTLLEVSSFDAQLPRNLDDRDLFPDMTDYPDRQETFTDTTFILLRCEITDIMRTMSDSRRYLVEMGKRLCDMSLQERHMWVQSCEQHLFLRYSRLCSPSSPLQWATQQLVSILTRKLRLHIQEPLQRHTTLTESERDRLFEDAVETLETTFKLRTDPRTHKWHWFFHSFNQWEALAYVLYCLCLQPLGKKAKRGWRAVEEMAVLRWNPMSSGIHREARQWRQIMRMMDQAKAQRRKALQAAKRRQSASVPSTGSASASVDVRGPPPDSMGAAVESACGSHEDVAEGMTYPALSTQQEQPLDDPGRMSFSDHNALFWLDQHETDGDADQMPGLDFGEDIPDFTSADFNMGGFP